jgi:hypothetical protein
MKTTITTVICTVLMSMAALSQDVITYKNGTEVKVKVTEVTSTEVKYKKFDNMEGPSYSILRTDVFMIKYENGTKEVFEEQTAPQNTAGNIHVITPQDLDDDDDKVMPMRHYGGPRVGMTFVGPGAFEDALLAEGKRTIYSQFGWQFETRIFSLQNGLSGMIEFVPAIGGLDMGKFIPSVSGLIGMRTKNGVEFGAGPNWALYYGPNAYGGKSLSSNFGVVLAGGMSLVGKTKTGKIYFPLNLAVVPSVGKKVTTPATQTYNPTTMQYDVVPGSTKTIQTGVKVTLLVGFNSRKD